MPYVLSLDQGTTSSRAILLDGTGHVAATAQRELPQIYPRTGWVEQDPYAILTSEIGSAIEAMKSSGARPRDVAAIGLANQRETTLVWDRETGKPIYNAIVWQDRRTASACTRLAAEGAEAALRGKTGLLLDPYFSATKIAWILDHVAGARRRAEEGRLAFGTVDSWLLWNLTDGQRHVTDRTNASRTMLYNIVEDRWDDDLLKLFRVPMSMMPEVVWSSERVDTVASVAELNGITIAGIAGDQQAALFGELCTHPGEAKCTYGTGCFLLEPVGETFVLSPERLLTTLVCGAGHRLEYALEGSVFVAGAVIEWLRDKMGLIRRASEIEALARSVEDAGGVVFVPAFTGLGAPHWDPYASGTIIGLGRGTERGHIARAALESIAFQVADVLDAMGRGAGHALKTLSADGGAAANNLLMQFQADLLAIPVERPAMLEATALGAAVLAGIAVGFWPDAETIAQTREAATLFRPHEDRAKIQAMRARWRDAVERAKRWNGGGA